MGEPSKKSPAFAGIFLARSAGLEPATFSVRSQTRSRTRGDREGHGVVVPLWYEQSARWPILSEVGTELTRLTRTTGF